MTGEGIAAHVSGVLGLPVIALRRLRHVPRWVRTADAAVGRRLNRRSTPVRVDRAMRLLSRSADRSRLWFGLGALLMIAGERRAAVRGLSSLTVASILANLVGKRVFGGDRPLLRDIPVGRRLRAAPTTPSFPSGHSASAAAFAVGVALESRRSGAVVAPLAAAVAYSRLHVGAHWASDVIGGSVLGAGVAVVGRALVPARRHEEPGGPVPEIRASVPTLESGAGLLVFLNPNSGKSVVRADPEGTIRSRLPDADVHVLAEGDDLEELITSAMTAPERPLVLGVCGGDGTVATVAHLARRFDVPFVGFPGGTFNHFVRSTGIESIDDAIDAVQSGSGARVDVAELAIEDGEPITVMNAGSVGIYPRLVTERDVLEKRLGKWAAGVVAMWRVLRTADPVAVEVDGRPSRVWSVFIGVDPNFSHTVAPMRRLRLEGSALDVRILEARSRAHAVAALAFGRKTSALLRVLRILPLRETTEMFLAEEVRLRITSSDREPAPFARDGEVEDDRVGGEYSVAMRIVPGGLVTYCRPLDSRA